MNFRVPTFEVFHHEISHAFSFLVSRHGFQKSQVLPNEFEATYILKRCEIRIRGGGWGQMASMRINLDGRDIPYGALKLSPKNHSIQPTGSPQLDDVRKIAACLQNEFADFFADPEKFAQAAWDAERNERKVALERGIADPQGTFFSRADKLWKNKKWAELTVHLAASAYPLGATWKERLKEASNHTE